MAIAFIKYVNITSGVGAGTSVARRDLIGRLFTDNILVPTGTIIEFDTLDEVGVYFGTSSNEYSRAVFYFGFINKNISRAEKISFARWTSADVAPRIFGDAQLNGLADWQAITDGSFIISLGGNSQEVSGLDFNAVGSFADVAAIIQAGIQAADPSAIFSGATVAYNAVKASYDFIGGATGAATITVSAGTTGTNILSQMGWSTAILSDGAVVQTPLEAVSSSTAGNDNFGSFLFMQAITENDKKELTEWNAAQNVKFIFCVGTLQGDAQALFDSIGGLAGSGITLLSETDVQFDEMMPMVILAATDYTKRNSVQNYMFQIYDALNAKVTDTTVSNDLDAIRVNYYGQTQSAGQKINFYQRGFLTGSGTSPVNMNTYANEMWLKDAAGSEIMTLLLSLPKVSANDTGRSQIISAVQGVIDEATFNGTISAGKELSTVQKLFVTEITGDEDAYRQIESIGYWLDCNIESEVNNGQTEFKADYTLVYAKDDIVRSVDGTHILI